MRQLQMQQSPYSRQWKFPFVVKCRNCGLGSDFRPAFKLISDQTRATLPDAAVVRWKDSCLRILRPKLFPWSDPDNHYLGFNRPLAGLVLCSKCPQEYKHIPDWPQDAYYKVECEEGELWAWNRSHLVVIRRWVETSGTAIDLPASENYYLRKIPKGFLKKKYQKTLLRDIDALLAAV